MWESKVKFWFILPFGKARRPIGMAKTGHSPMQCLRSAVRAKGGFAETAVNALTRQAEVTVEAYYKV